MNGRGVSRRLALAALAMAAALGSISGGAAERTLRAAAAASGRYFGAAVDPAAFDEKPYARLAAEQLGAVTPENQMKWGPVEPVRGRFDWKGADAVVAFAKAHGQKVRGHNLVWHSQLPSWLTSGRFSAAELRELMTGHVALEAGRYKGAIYAWDVVNEPFDDGGGWRKSIWFEAMGENYVEIALRAARAADPEAKLYINDYNIESDGPKARALYRLAASLKQKGAPLDGVGFESHFVVGRVPADMGQVMAKFAALGLDVAITELDVRVRTPPDARALETQAEDYAAAIGACLSVRRCVGISAWGFTDDRSWIPSFFSGYGAALPFDENYRPKPAFQAAVDALDKGAR